MVQNRSEPFGTGLKAEPNPWNQCILVRSGSVTLVVWFRFELVLNRTVATLPPTLLTLKKASFQGFGSEATLLVIKLDGFGEHQSALPSLPGSIQRIINFVYYVL